ncbi:MAG: MarR family transcriptional regulator [Paenibacillus sp.]|uniref:MarR family winged helix-turn-helix transcriptional regulator n=1 Tax=Paenibacillus sp. TaxID=58172 RepID=UPI0029080EE8|nr:MarR family transcriptional regulator [Paenibacillus sp.]MDU4696630.1 MarR family transcriptional regulator [Paenibacillus sp.]
MVWLSFDLDNYIDRFELVWSHTFRKMKSEIMHHHELGLTGPQFHMLTLIARKTTCNVSYLAEKLEVKPSAITVMIDRLVQSGYVERRHDEKDRRAVLLSVTERGAEVLAEARKKSREVLKNQFSVLSEQELEMMITILEKLSKNHKSYHKS